MGRVLVADDENGVRAFLAECLEAAGHDVVAVADGRAALTALREGGIELVLTDLRMPGADGMEVVRAARCVHRDVEVIVLTAFGAVASAVEAMKLGAFDYLEKPIASPASLRELVARALERRAQLLPRDEAPIAGEAPLTWGAPSMQSVANAIGRVAKASATVLLEGESGTGKEVIARTIHGRSPRAAAPFLAISCAVLSENLLESELFGHERGAFTGAHALRRGRLELANGGTFLLDEVGELRPALQAKLLRVLEERCFERVGGSSTIAVDVRFIAATHRDLKAMVSEGTFREDLYHRLAVFPIRVPPLRERRDDIVPLAETLLASLAAAAARTAPTFSDAAKASLTAAPWTGNVRQLRNAIERALILEDGAVLGEELFVDDAPSSPSPDTTTEPPTSLEKLERVAIVNALAAVSGNRRAAAARLGIGLRTLYEKLKRYDLR